MSSTGNEEIHPILIALMVVSAVIYFCGMYFHVRIIQVSKKRQRSDMEARHFQFYHDAVHIFPINFYAYHYLYHKRSLYVHR